MKIKSIIVAAVLVASAIFVACEKDSVSSDSQNASFNEIENTIKNDSETFRKDGKLTIVSAGLHRGRRWTARHNAYLESIGQDPVLPCSTSLGLCNISFFPKPEGSTALYNIALEPIPGVTRLEFIPQEEIDHAQDGDIFISDEDGRFSLPIEVSKELFGDEESRFITILPGNYIFDVSEEYPFGHVIVDYELTEEEFVN